MQLLAMTHLQSVVVQAGTECGRVVVAKEQQLVVLWDALLWLVALLGHGGVDRKRVL